jgi:uncharacterized RDD family membrane protein YckC
MIWTFAVLVAVVDCLVMPMLLGGQSVGKMLVGIRIVRKDGSRAHVAAVLLRNLVGYGLTLLTGGVGFLLCAFTPAGRALHDYLAGTMVIRGRRRPV